MRRPWGTLARLASVAALAAVTAGCQTTEARLANDDVICRSYGVAPGSPAYVQCRMQLDANRASVTASERFGRGEGIIPRVGRMIAQ